MKTVEELKHEEAQLQAKAMFLKSQIQLATKREELFSILITLGFKKMLNNPNDIFTIDIGDTEVNVFVNEKKVHVSVERCVHCEDQTIESAGTFITGVLIGERERQR